MTEERFAQLGKDVHLALVAGRLVVPHDKPVTDRDLAASYSIAVCALREAGAETLLSGALLIAEVRRAKISGGYGDNATTLSAAEERFTKALELTRSALG